jgi:inner membrane protein
VDNFTHAFVGAAMAECALPTDALSRTRAVFMCVGVVAANAPDVDLFYSGIIEEPLGYLLHHRGHSHTVLGLGALGILIWSGLRITPQVWRAVRGTEFRAMLLIAAALVSHLLMDTANGYGTHLFYPLSTRWVYGDSVFVLEPWLWAILGATLTLNADRRWRALPALLSIFLIGALAYIGLLPPSVLAVMLGVVAAAAVGVRLWNRKQRAITVLLATTAIFIVMAGLSRVVKAEARRAAAGLAGGDIIDTVADANPGVPWCWAVLTLQRAAGSADTLIARRATLSLLPGLWPATSCASARLATQWSRDASRGGNGETSPELEERRRAAIVWHRVWRIDVEPLRALDVANCRVGAWLQFGRVPYVADGMIRDLRFENPIGQNFTPMRVDDGSKGCPKYLTHWEMPRRDVLESSHNSFRLRQLPDDRRRSLLAPRPD